MPQSQRSRLREFFRRLNWLAPPQRPQGTRAAGRSLCLRHCAQETQALESQRRRRG